MKALSIRGLDPRLASALERETIRRGTSLNRTVLDLLAQALGIDANTEPSNGLRKLAGAWSAEEARDFEAATE